VATVIARGTAIVTPTARRTSAVDLPLTGSPMWPMRYSGLPAAGDRGAYVAGDSTSAASIARCVSSSGRSRVASPSRCRCGWWPRRVDRLEP
jgi:hypothetical protein